MFRWFIIIFISSVYTLPATWVQKITGNAEFNEDNSLTKYDEDFSDLDMYIRGNLTKNQNYTNEIIPFSTDFSKRNETTSAKNNTTVTLEIPESQTTTLDPDAQSNKNNFNETLLLPVLPTKTNVNVVAETNKDKTNITQPISPAPTNINPILQSNKNNVNETRRPRQDSSEEESNEDEEGGNMITGLLTAFLSGLSRPDGSIDLEAIIGLLGSLSTQNPDGTYDFTGLTELLRSFLGGGGDGGGSDVGAFAGGLLGAVIKGVANPPGPKGAGILTGKVVTGILPALSGPVPSDDTMMMNGKPTKAPTLDSGSFLTGFLKTALGSGGNGTMGGGKQSKYTLFKLIVSAVTGVFSAASSLSSKSDWD